MSENVFTPTLSTNEIWRDEDSTRCLTDDLDAMDVSIAALETAIDGLDDDYAVVGHTHTEYASSSHTHDYAATNHTHTGYASSSHTHTEYDANGAASSALTSANAYTDSKIDAIVGEGASTTLDTIGEISAAIEDNQDAIDVLNAAISNKANVSDLTSHTGNTTVHVTATERTNWNAAKTHADSAHAPSNAEKNQNAFSNVVVGTTTIAADSATDTLTLIAGSNVTLTPNADNDGITIAATDTVYIHPTTSGNKHIPAGGSSGQVLKWSADGTATWGTDNDTTYSAATQSAAGLMSASDKAKLDGIADGANNYTYTLPSAGTSLGGVKSGGDVTIASGIITVNDDSHNHVISNVDGLQDALDAKAASGHTHTVSGITDLTATAAELNVLDGITATTTELNYVDGVTSSIQTQLNNKAAASHTHSYAGSSSAGGAATSANKLNTNAGDANTPVYFSDGVPVACTSLDLNTSGSSASCTGNAATATKLATARTISLTGDVTGSVSFDGSANASITATVADDSHNHVISNVDGLQSALDAKAPIFTNTSGGVEYSYGTDSGKNVLTEISNMPQGFHTIYAISGTSGNPRTTESFRYFIHKTSTTIGWILAWDAQGSVFTNYQSAAGTFKGWKCVYDASPSSMILWSGTSYMQSVDSTPQVVTPSKKLSECRTGWMLLWSDYDPSTNTANDTDFCTTFIPKYTPSGGTWGGKCFYCDIAMYVGSDVTDLSTEQRCIKPVYVHDDCLKGSYQNNQGGRNDVVLRAVYEV